MKKSAKATARPTGRKPVMIRMDDALYELIAKAAETDRRTVSDWARLRLEEAAKRELAKK